MLTAPKAGITENKAKQPAALAFPNTQPLTGDVCHVDGAGASAWGLWVPPRAPHSLPISPFPDDGLKSHFHYFMIF